ncbi:MAG: phosphate ABC transporter permease PstA [Planctomycetes bacterium]|nr:phosphate ABC transporter permease PstA [Planctomycetota bacterium]
MWAVERRENSSRFELLLPLAEVRPGDRVFAVAETVHGAQPTWDKYLEFHDFVAAQSELIHHKRKHDIGELAAREEAARIALREVELEVEPHPAWVATRHSLRTARLEGDEAAVATLERRLAAIGRDLGEPPAEYVAAFERFERESDLVRTETSRVTREIEDIARGANRHAIWFATAAGRGKLIHLMDIVRAYPANQLGFGGKFGVYVSRWSEFLTDEPRESNNEGGVFPAIFGTVLMTLLMCIAVVPFGVLAALFLREYAKAGPLISLIRIAVNNLAGVPSIVFGVFGLGFFCYIVGASIDDLLFEARLPAPTFGKSGMLWASLTLSLMTLPVVIVATEEALAAVPSSVREGSFGCGASKWQTIRRIVLPRAMPGIMTGAILAMARGAGEVAPLMLVGAVKLAPELPIAVSPPFGLDRSFMHLGFHIYDLGFQSPNADAAKPMVYTTTLLLIAIIASLNLAAIWLRSRLRRKFVATQF